MSATAIKHLNCMSYSELWIFVPLKEEKEYMSSFAAFCPYN
jgi:hypothetical protein